jgi:chromosome partitioning protein
MERRGARVIAIGNQKGGVGKTTNAVHLARALVEKGRRVLLIDLDMNYGTTRHFGIKPEAFLGSFEMLIGAEPAENLILTSADNEEGMNIPVGLDIIPAARKLESVEEAMSKFATPIEMLKRPLDTLKGRYDYIFLDTAPNATVPTLAAYLNAEYFILSAMPDPFAIAGLNDALTDIIDARKSGNPNLILLGVVITGLDKRLSLANQLVDYVEEAFRDGTNPGSLKFKVSVGRSTVLAETQNRAKTLFETHSTHRVTDEYRALATEIEERLTLIENPTVAAQVVNG